MTIPALNISHKKHLYEIDNAEIGHILRHEKLLMDVMKGKMQERRPRGRPRIGMLNELNKGSYGQMKRRAEDREGWKCRIPETCYLTEH